MKTETVSILGVKVARMSLDQVSEWVRVMVDQGKPRHIVTANAEIIYRAYQDEAFAHVLDKADLVTADGIGSVWAARSVGHPVPERVTGIDLTHRLFELAEEKGWGIYFLGSGPEVVEKAVLDTLSKHPRLRIVGYRHGYFSQEETPEVVANIVSVKPEILLAAMGVPKQELFIQEHLKELNVPISIGVGGTFDVLAGTAKRAPGWMRRLGLEWLYRLIKEPSRANRMLALPKFVLAYSCTKKDRQGSKRMDSTYNRLMVFAGCKFFVKIKTHWQENPVIWRIYQQSTRIVQNLRDCILLT